ncbi:MAG TPA: hypothetical protein DG752_03005 [Leeuwenhoekiella sp.]|nr:hypothetical protein [Leeuwenhoekiella sp.]
MRFLDYARNDKCAQKLLFRIALRVWVFNTENRKPQTANSKQQTANCKPKTENCHCQLLIRL